MPSTHTPPRSPSGNTRTTIDRPPTRPEHLTLAFRRASASPLDSFSYRPATFTNTPAAAPPTNGPSTGTIAYPQSDEPFPLTGSNACMMRGPRSRAGLIAYPVVPPNDNPIDHTSIPTTHGAYPDASAF